MWQRFTENARRVVFNAQEEAGKRGDRSFVHTEHLLLALFCEENTASLVLHEIGVFDGVKEAIELACPITTTDTNLIRDMVLTPRSKRMIDLAYDEARHFNHNYIGTEHLLLAMIRLDGGTAHEILVAQGLELEEARIATLDMLNKRGIAVGLNGKNLDKVHLPSTTVAVCKDAGPRPHAAYDIDLFSDATRKYLLGTVKGLIQPDAIDLGRFFRQRNILTIDFPDKAIGDNMRKWTAERFIFVPSTTTALPAVADGFTLGVRFAKCFDEGNGCYTINFWPDFKMEDAPMFAIEKIDLETAINIGIYLQKNDISSEDFPTRKIDPVVLEWCKKVIVRN